MKICQGEKVIVKKDARHDVEKKIYSEKYVMARATNSLANFLLLSYNYVV